MFAGLGFRGFGIRVQGGFQGLGLRLRGLEFRVLDGTSETHCLREVP